MWKRANLGIVVRAPKSVWARGQVGREMGTTGDKVTARGGAFSALIILVLMDLRIISVIDLAWKGVSWHWRFSPDNNLWATVSLNRDLKRSVRKRLVKSEAVGVPNVHHVMSYQKRHWISPKIPKKVIFGYKRGMCGSTKLSSDGHWIFVKVCHIESCL